MPNWNTLKTKHGYAADEIISVLQKSIRRGIEEDAVFFGYEMLVSGEDLAEKFWQRIRVISVEDVGLASPDLIVTVYVLYQNYLSCKGKSDALLPGLMAVVLLTRSNKSRYVDELFNNLRYKVENEEYRRTVPDYAIDKHTQKGEELGRGDRHFWETASELKNDISINEKTHLKEILKRIK
jgi:replication-associated recombination protein RarA